VYMGVQVCVFVWDVKLRVCGCGCERERCQREWERIEWKMNVLMSLVEGKIDCAIVSVLTEQQQIDWISNFDCVTSLKLFWILGVFFHFLLKLLLVELPHQVSISSTLNVQIFRTNVVLAVFTTNMQLEKSCQSNVRTKNLRL